MAAVILEFALILATIASNSTEVLGPAYIVALVQARCNQFASGNTESHRYRYKCQVAKQKF